MRAPHRGSIAQTRAAIQRGELSPVALVKAHLERIAGCDRELNVFRTVSAEFALEQATAIEEAARRGDPLGPLAGVPVGLKDNIGVAGLPMTVGTRFAAGQGHAGDATVWKRLRAAGAVLLGKLHMSEWAIGGTSQNVHFGPARNPWDPERVTGGSSGGSGAALAAGMALATLGSDTAGSARIPAALCGVCALRGTAGRVSNHGSVPVAWTFDAICPMARSAADLAEVLAVIAGFDPADPASAEVALDDYVGALDRGAAGMRIGMLVGDWLDGLAPEVGAAVRAAAGALERAGAAVEEVMLPGRSEAFEQTAELVLAEAAWFHRERLRDRPEIFASDVATRLRRGATISGPRYGHGRQRQRVWRRRVLDALTGRDLLLAAACPIPAPLLEESDPLETTAALTPVISPWVLSRTPVACLPAGLCGGLPIGIQLIGRPFGEATVLRAGHAYQQVTDWHLQWPPGFGAVQVP